MSRLSSISRWPCFSSSLLNAVSRVWLGCIERYTWLAVFDENTRCSGHGMLFSWIPRKLSCPWYCCCLVDSGCTSAEHVALSISVSLLSPFNSALSLSVFWNDTEKISMSLRKC